MSKSPGGIAFPVNDAEYRKFVSQGLRNVIPVRKLPAGLSPDARYGYNFVIGGKNRGRRKRRADHEEDCNRSNRGRHR